MLFRYFNLPIKLQAPGEAYNPPARNQIFKTRKHFFKLSAILALLESGFLDSTVANPDLGPRTFLTPGSGIRYSFLSDSGSQTNSFESLVTIFVLKNTSILSGWLKFVATRKDRTTKSFFPFLFCCCCWIRDPGWINVRIRDKHPGFDRDLLSK